jgi:hypothetical protein
LKGLGVVLKDRTFAGLLGLEPDAPLDTLQNRGDLVRNLCRTKVARNCRGAKCDPIGFLAADFFPRFMGADPGANHLIFALFVGTALSISALPVIARTLMDIGLLQTELGAVVMSSAMFDDLVGWILFGVVLGMVSVKISPRTAPRPLPARPGPSASL